MKKKIITVVFILLAIGIGSYLYLNKVFLSTQFKVFVINKAQEFLQRKVVIEELRYHPLKGLLVKNLTIFREDTDQYPFVHIEEADIGLFLPTIIAKQEIIIPSIVIRQPTLHLIRYTPDSWNFSDLLEKKPASGKKRPFPALIGNVQIEDGHIAVTDKTLESDQTEIFENTNIKINVSLQEGIKFKAETQIPRSSAFIKIAGNYEVLSGQISGTATGKKIDAAKYFSMFNRNKKISLLNGDISDADIQFGFNVKDKTLSLNGTILADVDVIIDSGLHKHIKGLVSTQKLILTRKNYIYDIETSLTGKALHVTVDHDKVIQGDLVAENTKVQIRKDDIDLKGQFILNQGLIEIGKDKKILGEISTQNLQLQYVDKNLTMDGNMEIYDSAVQLGANFKMSGQILLWNNHFERTKERDIKLTGQFEVQQADLETGPHFHLRGDLLTQPSTLEFREGQWDVNTDLKLDNGKITIRQNKYLSGNISTRQTHVTVVNRQVNVSTLLSTDKTIYEWADKKIIADPKITLDLSFRPDDVTPLTYSGSADVTSGTFEGLPKIQSAGDISGTIKFITDQLFSDALNFTTLNSPFQLSGTLKNIAAPQLNVKISSQKANIALLNHFFPQYLKAKGLFPSGEAVTEITYQGPLRNPQADGISLKANLNKSQISGIRFFNPSAGTPASGETITDITGPVEYQNQKLSWKDINFTFRKTDYLTTGNFHRVDPPGLAVHVLSDTLDLTAMMILHGQDIQFTSLEGTYLDSTVDLKGNLNFQDINSAFLDFDGTVNLSLDNLSDLLPRYRERIAKFKPAGVLNMTTSFRGKPKNWLKGQWLVSAQSPQIFIDDLKLEDISLETQSSQKFPAKSDFKASFYEGTLALSLFLDLNKPELPFESSLNLADVNLLKLRKDSRWKKKDFTGSLSLNSQITGQWNQYDSIKGSGHIAVRDGHLGRLNLLKGIWKLFLIPEYENIIFTEGRANFNILNRRFETSDIFLKSQPADFYASGWIDFDQNINLDVNADFRETEILKSNSILKAPTAIIAQAQDYINFKIKGTLQHPEYEKQLQPGQAIKKATSAILEGAGGILEDMLPE